MEDSDSDADYGYDDDDEDGSGSEGDVRGDAYRLGFACFCTILFWPSRLFWAFQTLRQPFFHDGVTDRTMYSRKSLSYSPPPPPGHTSVQDYEEDEADDDM